jgi:hypothetical protein
LLCRSRAVSQIRAMDGLQGVNRNCPMCGSGEWETGEIVSGTSVDGSGNVLPMAQLVC